MTDYRAWAVALRAKEEAGLKMSSTVKEMWRRALGLPENYKVVVKEQQKKKYPY